MNKKGIKSLPKNLIPGSIEEAYKIQDELKLLYLSLKDNYCIGKKNGCTNSIAQKQINIFEPFYGNLFSKYSDISGCTLKSTNFYKPYIEPEISFRLKSDININEAPFNFDDSSKIFDGILPSIEIVDFRFGENIKEVGIKNLIVTNGASEYWVRGSTIFDQNIINLNDQEVKLFINNKIVSEGNTNMVLENPINSAIWIVNKLALMGEPMLKGQYISTGTCTPAIPISKDNFIKADFGKLGLIEINYI
jgi:2-keto-4-pentenoate hydratase